MINALTQTLEHVDSMTFICLDIKTCPLTYLFRSSLTASCNLTINTSSLLKPVNCVGPAGRCKYRNDIVSEQYRMPVACFHFDVPPNLYSIYNTPIGT